MIKKSVLAAGLAALAFAALPAIASATYPNPYLADNGNPVANTPFSVETQETRTRLATTAGNWVTCEAVKGEGEFETAETGWIKLTFHKNCHTKLNLKCGNDPNIESQAIQTEKLYFHLKTVDHEGVQRPGVLITPNPETNHFATFECQIIGKVTVTGTGIVGTITSPEKGVPSNTATLSFSQSAEGVQTHRTVTNDATETVEYDLETSIGGGAPATSSQEGEGTITFANGMKPELLTTSEAQEMERETTEEGKE
jgi:hypothetical protein